MSHMVHAINIPLTAPQAQRGAAFIVMMVILVLGVTAAMLGSFSSIALKISRENKSTDVLAQAKEALISYAVTSDTPGSLPCPNTQNGNNNGVADSIVSGNCPHYIGRLPWKTLGIPELRDSAGAPLWYALSKNFRNSSSNTINSDSSGTLSITGITPASNIAAIVFAPGASVNNQSRSETNSANCTTTNSTISENRCATNYLEGTNSNSSLSASPNTQYVTSDASTATAGTFTAGVAYTIKNVGSTNFTLIGATSNTAGLTFIATGAGVGTGLASPLNNDKLVFVSTENFIPHVEKRIAREIKQCLDDYAAQPSQTSSSERLNKYPWAVPISSITYEGSANTLLGRIPDTPTITSTTTAPLTTSNTSDVRVINLLNALAALDIAVDNCQDSDTSTHITALFVAGTNLENLAKLVRDNQPTTPLIPTTVTSPAITAGDRAQDSGRCGNIENGSSTTVQNNLNSAYSVLPSIMVTVASPPEDASMPDTWPASCILSTPAKPYWANWKELVLYRVSNAFRPNGTKVCGTSCLSILGNGNSNQGSGNYRASVIIAGKNISQTARNPTNINSYLEGANSTSQSTTNLEVWQLSEQATKGVNDFVVCVDGKGSNQNSKCY